LIHGAKTVREANVSFVSGKSEGCQIGFQYTFNIDERINQKG